MELWMFLFLINLDWKEIHIHIQILGVIGVVNNKIGVFLGGCLSKHSHKGSAAFQIVVFMHYTL